MNPNYASVASRAEHCCEYCQAPEAVFNFPFEVEHIAPLRCGGSNHESNLCLSCRGCNLFKSDQVEGIDPQTNLKTPLFHPRKHVWTEHFTVDEAATKIEGKSAIGRATVAALQMNRPAQVAARRNWMLLSLWP